MKTNTIMRTIAYVACLTAPLCTAVHASTLSLTETATVSGTVGATSFTDATLTITQLVNTAAVTTSGNTYTAPSGESTLTISGIGSLQITHGSFVDDQSYFGVGGLAFTDSYSGFALGQENSVFSTYTLSSVLDATTGTLISNATIGGAPLTLPTSLGALLIADASAATFQASTYVTPEPATIALLSTGMLGLAGRLRRYLA